MTTEIERYRAAIERFDEANAQDPNVELDEGRELAKELLYARRMTRCLEQLAPEASEPLRLAVRAQHIRRWQIPRSRYPSGRDGYRRWRTDLAAFHAQTAGDILQAVGYDGPTIERVQALITKQRLKADPESQLLEDVACLVFLQFYFPEFSGKHEEEKVIHILRRTWKKMSVRGHAAALELTLADPARRLLARALEKEEGKGNE